MVCPSCTQSNPEGARFCTNCGSAIQPPMREGVTYYGLFYFWRGGWVSPAEFKLTEEEFWTWFNQSGFNPASLGVEHIYFGAVQLDTSGSEIQDGTGYKTLAWHWIEQDPETLLWRKGQKLEDNPEQIVTSNLEKLPGA
jgi:hypothetical protein